MTSNFVMGYHLLYWPCVCITFRESLSLTFDGITRIANQGPSLNVLKDSKGKLPRYSEALVSVRPDLRNQGDPSGGPSFTNSLLINKEDFSKEMRIYSRNSKSPTDQIPSFPRRAPFGDLHVQEDKLINFLKLIAIV